MPRDGGFRTLDGGVLPCPAGQVLAPSAFMSVCRPTNVLLVDRPAGQGPSPGADGLASTLLDGGRLVTQLPRPGGANYPRALDSFDVVVLLESLSVVSAASDVALVSYVAAGGVLIRTEPASFTASSATLFALTPLRTAQLVNDGMREDVNLFALPAHTNALLRGLGLGPVSASLAAGFGPLPISGAQEWLVVNANTTTRSGIAALTYGAGVVLHVNDRPDLLYPPTATSAQAAHEVLWGNLVDYAAQLQLLP